MPIYDFWANVDLKKRVKNIKLGNQTIEEIDKGKLLGITFDNKLTVNDHIKHICMQASNKLYALARISHYLDEQKRKMLMKSFVISQLLPYYMDVLPTEIKQPYK